MKTPTVYVVQDNGNKNLTPAMGFGTIKVLANRDLPCFGDNTHALRRVREGLKDYDPETDFIILTGDPLLILAVGGFITEAHGKVRCLKWDRQNEKYLFVEMQLGRNLNPMPRCAMG